MTTQAPLNLPVKRLLLGHDALVGGEGVPDHARVGVDGHRVGPDEAREVGVVLLQAGVELQYAPHAVAAVVLL